MPRPCTVARLLSEIKSARQKRADVLQAGERIETQSLLLDEPTGVKLDVVIQEVTDPSQFWITLHSCQSQLTELMQQLNKYCSSSSPDSSFSGQWPGLFCAAFHSQTGQWHRCQVANEENNNDDDDEVLVFFIDYGSMSCVAKSNVRFLPRHLAQLPGQAIECRLASCVPMDGGTQWPVKATKLFFKLAHDCHSTNGVASVVVKGWQKTPQKLSLELVLTQQQGSFVTKAMIRAGLAKPDPRAFVHDSFLKATSLLDNFHVPEVYKQDKETKTTTVSSALQQLLEEQRKLVSLLAHNTNLPTVTILRQQMETEQVIEQWAQLSI